MCARPVRSCTYPSPDLNPAALLPDAVAPSDRRHPSTTSSIAAGFAKAAEPLCRGSRGARSPCRPEGGMLARRPLQPCPIPPSMLRSGLGRAEGLAPRRPQAAKKSFSTQLIPTPPHPPARRFLGSPSSDLHPAALLPRISVLGSPRDPTTGDVSPTTGDVSDPNDGRRVRPQRRTGYGAGRR